MAEQAGQSVRAIAEGQAALSRQHGAAADADCALTEAVASAHAATVEGVRRLDAIAAEIDRAVANQTAIGLDTAIGAREFQRFLIAKQREILAVVTAARELAAAKKAAFEKLAAQYTISTG
ncbi:DUF4226 domain-containing protein [Candidatus Mycobacterium methanotrophicum]|uniref:DUF4226 domain-containing protein n=1 Tax=Candidatus Mycobacterium methanotrophicum TaxID=2943498 RepID=A0ABY4QKQ4_9MYCO|nr:DUF4226 domain-containing protein [Candidatus Mycobacterium methanotrophicum]UQX11057.1 DUF4226 domain-containing protein [Candidatus Mycobacterium methanotrophicum]